MFLTVTLTREVTSYLSARRATKGTRHIIWERVVFAGIFEAVDWIVSALANARQIIATPGYQDVPFRNLVLLLIARPCPLGLLSIFSLAIPSPEQTSTTSTDDATDDGRRRARSKVLAKTVATFAIAHMLILILSAWYPIFTVIAARYRGFYPVSKLTPYCRGLAAACMYGGGLAWTVLFPFVILLLIFVVFSHLLKIWLEDYNYGAEFLQRIWGELSKASQAEARASQEEHDKEVA